MNFIKLTGSRGPSPYVNVDLIETFMKNPMGSGAVIFFQGDSDQHLEVNETPEEVIDLIREVNTITTHVPTEVDLPQPEGVLDVAERGTRECFHFQCVEKAVGYSVANKQPRVYWCKDHEPQPGELS